MASQMPDDNEAPSRHVFRPVQFLGNKSRVLDAVVGAINADLKPGSHVWEPFTGSSVVAQALAFEGYSVTATDALRSSVCFARAMLGVEREHSHDTESVLGTALEVSKRFRVPAWANEWIDLENQAVARLDGDELIRLGTIVPQQWRNGEQRSEIVQDELGPVASIYAGTYFGLRQAVEIDALRSAIDDMLSKTQIGQWHSNVLLTALCSAASAAVFSAGKHFAQPINTTPDKVLDFHRKRIAHDRSVDIRARFATAAAGILAAARPAWERHDARHLLIEDAHDGFVRQAKIQAIYADPPYTAQQYSRFYHLLETIVSGERPRLQKVRGTLTTGLYPDDRYKSPFCSRRQAPAAFERLVRLAKEAEVRLVLSYSVSESGITGNARTIQLDDLVRLFEGAFGAKGTRVERLELTYKQFNHSSLGVTRRDDTEVIIVGEPNAR